MLLNENQKKHLLTAINRIANRIFNKMSGGWSVDIEDVILNNELYHAVFEYDKHPDILEKIPKTHRRKVIKALELLRERINETRELLVNNPPHWVKNAALAQFFKEVYYPIDIEHVVEEHRDELIRLVPVSVSSWDDVRYSGRDFEGLILYPTEEELEKLEVKNIIRLYRSYFEKLLGKTIEFIPEKQAVKIYDYEITFPRSEYYRILRDFNKYDIIKNMVKEDMKSVLGELEQYGSVKVGYNTLSITIRPEIIERLNKEHGLNIKNIVVFFSFDPSTKTSEKGEVVVKLGKNTLTITKPYNNICYTGNCPDTYIKSFRFSNYSEIPRLVNYMLERTREILLYTRSIEEKFIGAGRRQGYGLDILEGINYLNNYSSYTRYTMVKKTDKGKAVVKLTIDYERQRVIPSYDVYVWIRRNVPDDVIEEFKYRARDEGIRREFEMSEKQRNYWLIMSGGINVELDKLEEVFREADKVLEIASEAYEDYIVEAKRKREKIKLSQEHYAAIYITNNVVDGAYIPVERTTGRPELVMYSVISRIASKHGVPGSPSSYQADIIVGLFDKGYITVDKNLRVYINGKRYVDLLRQLKISPTEALAYEEKIASWLVAMYLYRKMGGGLSGRGYIKALAEKNLFSDKVLQALITMNRVYIPPEDMAYNIGGKPAWHHLSPATKKMYLENLYLADKEKIFFDPALSTVFHDAISDIEKDLLTSGNPSIITRLLVEAKPKLIGLPRNTNVRVVRGKDDFYGVDAGEFIVQVYRPFPLLPERNEFVVYRKDTKIGFIFRCRTLSEAVAEAALRYDRIYTIYRELEEEYSRKASVGDGYALQLMHVGEYKIPYLIKGQKTLFINEHTPERIRKKEEAVSEVI